VVGLDELVTQCLDEAVKPHIREALKSYEAGAYRASIVSAYIAVCFDLIAKARSLAEDGDTAAALLISDLEKLHQKLDKKDPSALGGLLNFERNLLEEFRDKFGFFGQHEFEDLERLRSDRNRCAHPSFANSNLAYAPSAELARLHIRNAVVLVLSQEPKQGRAAIANVSSIILSTYFPDDLETAKDRLSATEIYKGRPPLIIGMIDRLMFGACTKGDQFYGKTVALVAIEAIVELRRDIALPRVITNIEKLFKVNDKPANEFSLTLSLSNSEIGGLISENSRTILKTLLKKENKKYLAGLINGALKFEWCRDIALSRIIDLLPEHYESLGSNLSVELIDHAAILYSSAKSWDEANSIAKYCSLPFIEKFSEKNIDLIFNNAKSGKADLLGSHSLSDFVKGLRDKSPLGQNSIDSLLEKNNLEYYIK
jgi:hypothetical protein